jgi:hypothetical protein
MRRCFSVLALLACCVPAAVFAGKFTYIFTTFDFPGATNTNASGINNAGTIVGWFQGGGGGATSGAGASSPRSTCRALPPGLTTLAPS